MQNSAIHSDQLYNWSVHERLPRHTPPPAPGFGQTTCPSGASHPSWLSDRALQTVRPSRLQMPTGSGTRAQILLVDQSGRQPTRDGLRPRGVYPAGLRLSAELPESAAGAGAHLQYQPRVITASSQVLTTNAHGAFTLIPARYRLGWDPRRQFLAELAASWLCFVTTFSNSGDLP
jgi:hypothetical protein